jgi:hypothetical protein
MFQTRRMVSLIKYLKFKEYNLICPKEGKQCDLRESYA